MTDRGSDPGVLELDLGRRDDVAVEPEAPRAPVDRRTVALRALGVVVAVLVLAAAAPEHARPDGDVLAVSVRSAGDGAAPVGALDHAPLLLDVVNSGPETLVLEGFSLAGATTAPTAPTRVAAGGRAQVALDVVPDCALAGEVPAVTLTARSTSGSRDLELAARPDGAPLQRLCPATEAGVHTTVTGYGRSPTGRSVEARVVNHGTVLVSLVSRPLEYGFTADGSTIYLDPEVEAEDGIDLARPGFRLLPLVRTAPLLPRDLAPGESVVLTLRLARLLCAGDRSDVYLEAQGQNGFQRVTGGDAVVAELLAVTRQDCPTG